MKKYFAILLLFLIACGVAEKNIPVPSKVNKDSIELLRIEQQIKIGIARRNQQEKDAADWITCNTLPPHHLLIRFEIGSQHADELKITKEEIRKLKTYPGPASRVITEEYPDSVIAYYYKVSSGNEVGNIALEGKSLQLLHNEVYAPFLQDSTGALTISRFKYVIKNTPEIKNKIYKVTERSLLKRAVGN